MEYLTPVRARTHSFKEFMEEWVLVQFMRNLEEFGLDKPWFWGLFLEELEYAHHSMQVGLYLYRSTLWFDEPIPGPEERKWLRAKYPTWGETFEPFWERLDQAWGTRGEPATKAYVLPVLCNLCQLPALFIRPGHNTARTLVHDGRKYVFCSEPCQWIFEQQVTRFADHHSVVDRILLGEAPGDLPGLLEWMGFNGPDELGADLHRGAEHLWRVPRGHTS
jgi:toluene monooxygenase system protein A